MKYNKIIFNNINIDSLESFNSFNVFSEQLDIDTIYNNSLDFQYLFYKLVSLCTKKGEKKMAIKQIFLAFKLIKQFFRLNPIYFIKIAVVQMEPFIFLHTIPVGKKEKVFPRILPENTRTHNALNLIVSQAFQQRSSFRFFYISLAHSIIDNSMPNNIHTKKVKEVIEIAEFNKKNIKHSKKKKRYPDDF